MKVTCIIFLVMELLYETNIALVILLEILIMPPTPKLM